MPPDHVIHRAPVGELLRREPRHEAPDGRRVLDLFCGGAGGWSLGLHRAGFSTVAACEIDPWRRERFLANFPSVRMYDDVRHLTADRLRADGAFPDIIVGSPPCKEFSAVGRGGGLAADDLFFEFTRIVGECRPRWFAFENSPLLRTRGADRVLHELEQHGYTCWPLVVGTGNAAAAHKRKRVWVLGADAASLEGWAARFPWLGADTDRDDVRQPIVPGRSEPEETFAELARVFHGPVGSASLGSSIRAFDGVPGRLAERARAAYGDAVSPVIPYLIGRAILAFEPRHDRQEEPSQ